MFENLTSQQKIMFVLLGIVALICLVLLLYFALSKKSCPDPNKSCPDPNKCTPPSLVKFAISKADPPSSIPWTTPTYYKYSYYINDPSKDGDTSDISLPVVAPTGEETNPIIQVTLPPIEYKIKVYRAVDDGGSPGTFTVLDDVTVDNKTGLFTDTNNPSPTKPPKPSSPPKNVGWGGGGLTCPTDSPKCTGPCTGDFANTCTPTNPWTCTDGTSKSGCNNSDTYYQTDGGCNNYCFFNN